MSSNHCQANKWHVWAVELLRPTKNILPHYFPRYPFSRARNTLSTIHSTWVKTSEAARLGESRLPRRIPQCWTAGHRCCLPDKFNKGRSWGHWIVPSQDSRSPGPLWWALHLFSWKRCSPKMPVEKHWSFCLIKNLCWKPGSPYNKRLRLEVPKFAGNVRYGIWKKPWCNLHRNDPLLLHFSVSTPFKNAWASFRDVQFLSVLWGLMHRSFLWMWPDWGDLDPFARVLCSIQRMRGWVDL